MAEIDGIKHTTVEINGIQMHVAEKGEGPAVLLLHGFPELWYSWRRQILALSALGYRAVAPDMRGFGGSGAPAEASQYTYFHVVGDLVALIDWLGGGPVFVAGHDCGAVVAWQLGLFRPEKVKGLVNMGVAFVRRRPEGSVLEALREAYGEDHYMTRFQVPGEMEAELAEIGGVEKLLAKLFTHRTPGPWLLPKGEWFKDLPPRPSWISEEEFAFYVSKFDHTGITGGFNHYRAINLNWELTAPWAGAKVRVPVKFIVGDLDLTYHMPGIQDYIHKGGMQQDVPLLEDVVVLEGVGHFLQQERPDEITKHIYDFVEKYKES